MEVKPFSIEIPQDVLDDLRQRLGRSRWPDQLPQAGWDYGTDLDYLQGLAAYWQNGFDWRQQEAHLNTLPQFKAEAGELEVHFVHLRSYRPDATPLLMVHGWPSAFTQMLRIAPLLADRFHLVIPSLPGYGFSGRPARRGISVAEIAGAFHSLMTEGLGYPRYGLRGSDLGAGVTAQMALQHPDAVIGHHTGGTNPWIPFMPADLSPAEQEFVANVQRWTNEEMAYARLQATRPQTVAYGLNDSPIGLAAWIVEKLRRWSDCDGDLDRSFSRDEILTLLTIYWATQTIGSSIRLYYETSHSSTMNWGVPDVPTALAMPPADMFPTPKEWAARFNRIDRWTELTRGGHFPEHEVSEEMAADIRAFFDALQA
jgi:pimeloyl-ACP methyl ester carboxylesterase